MHLLLPIIPFFAAALVLMVNDHGRRSQILMMTALLHLAGTITTVSLADTPDPSAWLALDALGGWFLLAISGLFTLCSWYAQAYLEIRHESHGNHRVLVFCLLVFLGLASVLTMATHPGVVWVAMETITLATCPLIYFNRHQRSLEATWKYLVIGSVGVALALLGTLFVAYAAHLGGVGNSLLFPDLIANAAKLPPAWMRAGFVLLVIGYGTKMGLAPLHAWKPDAYGETPGLVGAVLAGGVTSCAFLALLRLYAVVVAAGQGALAQDLLLVLGFLSMAWAAVFLIRQNDIKRMLAYSSVEHMGILAIGVGLGGGALRFALWHVWANALIKTALFLSAGNIHRAFASKHLPFARGAIVRVPVSGWVFLIGALAITGTPPFAAFISEFGIANHAFVQGQYLIAGGFLVLLAVIFMGMSSTVLQVVHGEPDPDLPRTAYEDTPARTAPLIVALGAALVLGVWLPAPLERLLAGASAILITNGVAP